MGANEDRKPGLVDLHRNLIQFRCPFASTIDPLGSYLIATYAEFLTILSD